MLSPPWPPFRWTSARSRAAARSPREIADDVQRYIDAHTTVGVERTIAARVRRRRRRTTEGAPLVNTRGRPLPRGGPARPRHRVLPRAGAARRAPASVQDAAERLAFAPRSRPRPRAAPVRDAAREALASAHAGGARRASTRRATTREALKARIAPGADAAQVRHRRHGQHLRRRRAGQGRGASPGADIVAVIRATAQSLLDYVPHGATTEGYGGTFATQENFKHHPPRARRGERARYGRYIHADELLVGPLHGGDRVDGGGRAARHAPQRRDVRHPLPRHQHVPHLRRPVRLAADHRAQRASSSTRARTTT